MQVRLLDQVHHKSMPSSRKLCEALHRNSQQWTAVVSSTQQYTHLDAAFCHAQAQALLQPLFQVKGMGCQQAPEQALVRHPVLHVHQWQWPGPELL